MAAFLLLFENERALRRERVFRDRGNPIDNFTDIELIARYRFPIIKDIVQHPTSRSHAIPALQLFINFLTLERGELTVVNHFVLLQCIFVMVRFAAIGDSHRDDSPYQQTLRFYRHFEPYNIILSIY